MWNNQNQLKNLFSFMSNLQTYYHFKLDFQKVDQHTGGTGGKWLIHGTKRRKDNQLQSLELRWYSTIISELRNVPNFCSLSLSSCLGLH